jgi:type IV secretory pathway ATPase VirB11/archaellum biosynthesis ATPase
MCILRGVEGRVAQMDSIASPYELFSADCINSQLKQLALLSDVDFDSIRYDEEVIIEFDVKSSAVIKEYVGLIRQTEVALLNPDTFGKKEDDYYIIRKKLLNDALEYLFQNPFLAARKIEEYKEPEPTRGIFLEGYRRFGGTLLKIYESLKATKMYALTQQFGDMRNVFLSFAGMKTAAFVESITIEIPPDAKPVDKPDAKYSLPYGMDIQIYELPGKEANLYVQKNTILVGLNDQLKKMLKQTINSNMQPILDKLVDYGALYERKLLEYRQYYLDAAATAKIPITTQEALAMAKETVNWTLGLGSPLENIALDKDNITDIYIDAENSPLYLEHVYYGTCHTQFRYNRQLLEYAFLNLTLGAKLGKKLDEKNPLIDVMLNRLGMRCHLQGPPATFGELQGAFRIMKPTPFTYSQYLHYYTMSGFFAGYDDTMVSLGNSEGVMGVKGCGKTSFTAAKITAIGTKKRILPIQDIEEIPTRAYRKYGFHIGAAKIAEEEDERTALSLVKMTSALLRMGEAAVIINELRSRTAVQGIINLLNTQPGVFALYNFHGESLKDVQDRLELVFGIPSAAMFATDRYTFMHKFRFGRKDRLYRIIRRAYESDPEARKFVETFTFQRGPNIQSSQLNCNFLKNPEAAKWVIDDIDVGKLQNELDVVFIPPALKRRSDDTGITPEQYFLESFMKGKVYSQVYRASEETKNKNLAEMGFVLKCNAALRKLMAETEKETGEIDYADLQKAWDPLFKNLVKKETQPAAQATQSAQPPTS